MNTLSSIRSCRTSNNKTFTLTNFSLPGSLCFYNTVIESEVDTTNKKVGEYVNKIWFPYYGTNMISTDQPSSLSTDYGSFILSDANNYVDYTGNTETFNSGQGITICFWFKLTSTSGSGSIKFPFRLGLNFGTNLITPEINYNASGVLTNLFVYGLNTSGARFVPNTSLLNTWNHFSIVFNNAAVAQLYVNGSTLFNSTNGNNTFSSTVNAVGGRMPHNTTHVPQGLITEIRIYKEALSQTRINNIYTWNGSGTTQPSY